MENHLGLVLKVLLLSTLLSLLIKYVAPSLMIPGTNTIALVSVLLPSVILAIALLWRFQRQNKIS
ncbi:MAG: hypothetical protein KME32_01430 [Mojavia pulchra JT2-VF2]|jgi:hypothetical protein|uniref:Uncharacterized protein n=1 Tax=Mojavia pulchra JT2-VF2 TaxID=287848 RepID=A0A951PVY3_9NOST|nr:hypothetical protein [Mojavia pulchra JT2-VF2]